MIDAPKERFDLASIPALQEFPDCELRPQKGFEIARIDLGVPASDPGHEDTIWVLRHPSPISPQPGILQPVIFVAAAGGTSATGVAMTERELFLYSHFARKGFTVVGYGTDGTITPQVNDALLVSAYKKFRRSAAGLVNARNAIDFATRSLHWTDPERYYTMGHSSAGKLALLLSEHDDRIKACISFAGFTDVNDQLDSDGKQIAKTLFPDWASFAVKSSPVTHETHLTCPLLLYHGRGDKVVAIQASVGLANRHEHRGHLVRRMFKDTDTHAAFSGGDGFVVTWLSKVDECFGAGMSPMNARIFDGADELFVKYAISGIYEDVLSDEAVSEKFPSFATTASNQLDPSRCVSRFKFPMPVTAATNSKNWAFAYEKGGVGYYKTLPWEKGSKPSQPKMVFHEGETVDSLCLLERQLGIGSEDDVPPRIWDVSNGHLSRELESNDATKENLAAVSITCFLESANKQSWLVGYANPDERARVVDVKKFGVDPPATEDASGIAKRMSLLRREPESLSVLIPSDIMNQSNARNSQDLAALTLSKLQPWELLREEGGEEPPPTAKVRDFTLRLLDQQVDIIDKEGVVRFSVPLIESEMAQQTATRNPNEDSLQEAGHAPRCVAVFAFYTGGVSFVFRESMLYINVPALMKNR